VDGRFRVRFYGKIKDNLNLNKIDILFAPHHGRDSGKVPKEILDMLDPQIIVIGEAPSKHLNYYNGYDTITQNSAGDIYFDCKEGVVHIYVSSPTYSVDYLDNNRLGKYNDCRYIGTLKTRSDN